MAKDGAVTCWFQPYCGVESGTVGGRHRDQVADAVTEATQPVRDLLLLDAGSVWLRFQAPELGVKS